MKPEQIKPWEEVAARTAVDYFLRNLEARREQLRQEISAIYPELGKQAYRFRGTSPVPWAVEQYLIDIANKDADINRLNELTNSIVSEIKRIAEAA